MSTPRLALLGLVLAGGLLWLAGEPLRGPRVSPVLEPLAAWPAVEPEAGAALRAERVSALDPLPVAPTTARQYLAQYYGERWAEIEPRLEAQGLDEPFQCLPWNDVAAEFARKVALEPEHRAAILQGQLRWAEPLDAAWLHEHFAVAGWDGALDESEVLAIEALVEPANAEIRARAEALADLTEFYLHEMWRSGSYERAPFTTLGLSQRKGFHSQSIGGYGWAVTLTLNREECPDVEAVEDEILALCRRRDLLALDYLVKRSRR